MEVVIDTSALIAVILGEPERKRIIQVTEGVSLIGPESIPWEVGNAFSAMFKRKRLKLGEAKKAVEIFRGIPIKYFSPDLGRSLEISKEANIYAYDAYFIEGAQKYRAPLLTLDQKLTYAARQMKIKVLEV